VLVLAGEEEVLVDGIKDFAQRLSKLAPSPTPLYSPFFCFLSRR
jgi:hypothetical protein